ASSSSTSRILGFSSSAFMELQIWATATFGPMHFKPEHAQQADRICEGTMVAHLGMVFSVDEEGRFCATMPVEARTHQPMGLLHGGATAALAESLGSMGSALLIDLKKHGVVGIELNVNRM